MQKRNNVPGVSPKNGNDTKKGGVFTPPHASMTAHLVEGQAGNIVPHSVALSISLQEFIDALTGKVNAPNRFVAVPPKGALDEDGKALKAVPFYMSLELVKTMLRSKNAQHYNIYYSVNDTASAAGALVDVVAIRALYADIDARQKPVTDMQKDALASFPLQPHLTIETSPGNHQHLWLIEMSPLELQTLIEPRMIEWFGSDPSTISAARILRMPGFVNQKPDAGGFVVKAWRNHDLPRYALWEIELHFDVLMQPRDAAIQAATDAPERAILQRIRDYPPPPPETLAALLAPIPADDRGIWLKIGGVVYRIYAGTEHEDAAMDGFDAWAATAHNYSPGETALKWRESDFGKCHTEATFASIVYLHRQHGGMVQWPPKLPALKAVSDDQHAARAELVRDYNDAPWSSIRKCAVALRALGFTFKRDLFSMKTHVTNPEGVESQLNDDVLIAIQDAMHGAKYHAAEKPVYSGIMQMANAHGRHPVREYLASLEWDGVARLDRLFQTYLGAEDTQLNRALGPLWAVAHVRRVMEPGAKFDLCTTFVGEQGCGKSSFLRIMAVRDDWFTDNVPMGADAKVTIELTAGKWIVETAELAGMLGKEVEAVKAFVTRQSDMSRLAYGRITEERPRQFVLSGTTNKRTVLKDATGGRRFPFVDVRQCQFTALIADREQLWAEAAHMERQWRGMLELPPHLAAQVLTQAEERRIVTVDEDAATAIFNKLGEGRVFLHELCEAVAPKSSGTTLRQVEHAIRDAAQQAGWIEGKSVKITGLVRRGFKKGAAIHWRREAISTEFKRHK